MRLVNRRYIDTSKQYILDVKDKKILELLSESARLSNTQIAKKVSLSKDAVRHRIKNFERHGIIAKYLALVNLQAFGYMVFHFLVQLNKPTDKEEEKIISVLSQLPFVRAILRFNGKYDLQLAVVARSMLEVESIHDKIIDACGNYLQSCELLVLLRTFKSSVFPGNFFDLKEIASQTKKKLMCDEMDKEILHMLSNDARRPIHEIAVQVGLSADAVTYRMKKMQHNGILIKYVPAINYGAIGYHMYLVMLDIGMFSSKDESTIKTISDANKNILWSVKSIGAYNALFYVVVKDTNVINDVVSDLRRVFAERIRNFEVVLAYEEHKYTYLPRNLEL